MNKKHKKGRCKMSKCKSPFTSSEIKGNLSFDNEKDPLYEIKKSETIGRYMVARENIKAGRIIIKEDPIVVGHCVGEKVQCLGCYKELENTPEKISCKGCGWPVCSTKCSGIGTTYGHSKNECLTLNACNSRRYLNWDDLEEMRVNYHSIVPLRCLILKRTDPKSYQILMNMESHNDIRKSIPELWIRNQHTVVDKILKEWKLTQFTEDEIHTICGILEVNAFEIGHQGINIRGIYPTAFFMSHDCVPNTNHSDDTDNFTLTVRASVDIPQNFLITLSYAHTLQGTSRRREHLRENKFFECFCKKCSDPTELETYMSALICPKCKTGFILSENPLDNDSNWRCNKTHLECPGYSISSNSLKLSMDRINVEYERIDCNDIKSLENFLKKYRNVLHPNHYIFLSVKLSLSQLYGRINGFLIHELSDEQLMRKIDLCREIMKIFNIVEPGLTKLRGVTLYELHAPLMILLTRQFERGTLNKCQIKLKLKEIVLCLVEAKDILELEPLKSVEGAMGIAAKEALVQMKDWERITGKL